MHIAKGVFRGNVPLLCGLAIPHHSLRIVLRDTMAFRIHPAKIVLRFRVALLGGFAEQVCGLGIILGNTLAFLITLAEVVLAISIPLVGGLAKPKNSLHIVLGEATAAIPVHLAKIALADRVSFLRGLAVPTKARILAHMV